MKYQAVMGIRLKLILHPRVTLRSSRPIKGFLVKAESVTSSDKGNKHHVTIKNSQETSLKELTLCWVFSKNYKIKKRCICRADHFLLLRGLCSVYTITFNLVYCSRNFKVKNDN